MNSAWVRPLRGGIWLALLLPVLAFAEVGGLYEASVSVTGRSAPERQRAVEDGFRQVLVKVSGQRSVLQAPAVVAEVGKAATLLATYTYEAAPARLPGQPVDPAMTPLRLRMTFDRRGTQAVLARAEAPVWGASRPAVYLWVGRDGPGGRQAWGPDSAQGLALLDAAAQRGLPVVLTLSDTAVPLSTGLTLPPAIREAAARNSARVVLGAAASGTGNRWKAAGVLVVDGVGERIEAVGTDEFAALRELVAVAADRLGARYAVVARPDRVQVVRLRVGGVPDVAAHAAVSRWLAGLPQVKVVAVAAVSAGAVEYRLTVAGELPRLLDVLATDSPLGAVKEGAAQPDAALVEAVFSGQSAR